MMKVGWGETIHGKKRGECIVCGETTNYYILLHPPGCMWVRDEWLCRKHSEKMEEWAAKDYKRKRKQFIEKMRKL